MNHYSVFDSDSNSKMSSFEASSKAGRRQSESGQIIVEYVLLLVIAIGLATILTRALVSRTQGDEGIVIRAWEEMLNQIAADHPDDIKRDGEDSNTN
jgi:hypothetical protein